MRLTPEFHLLHCERRESDLIHICHIIYVTVTIKTKTDIPHSEFRISQSRDPLYGKILHKIKVS